MFKPVAMMRLSLIILQRDERAVLRLLGKLGVLQIVSSAAPLVENSWCAADYRAEIGECDHLLQRLEELKQFLMPKKSSRCGHLPASSLTEARKELAALETAVEGFRRRRQNLASRQCELSQVSQLLVKYSGLDLPLDPPNASSFLHFVTGTLPAGQMGNLPLGRDVALLPLAERGGRQTVVALTTRAGRAALDQTLAQAGFQCERLPVVPDTTVDEQTAANQRQQNALVAEAAAFATEVEHFAEANAPRLDQIESVVSLERRLLTASQNFSRTETAVWIQGWIPAREADSLESRLQAAAINCYRMELQAPEKTDETIPVLLQPPRWLRPFERLVTAYGLPRYHELAPTLFVAVSYLLMFGLMFGDVGHGAILALVGWFLILRGQRAKVKDVGRLLLWGGSFSLLFGWVYGSFFGLADFRKYALWQDPLAGNPMKLMGLTVGVGIVMISLGMILNFLNCRRGGNSLVGWLGKHGVAGLVFYWAALGLVMGMAGTAIHHGLKLSLISLLVLSVGAWMGSDVVKTTAVQRSPSSEAFAVHWLTAILESLVGAFEAVLGFLANTISFVRLAAYAMSHAALLAAAWLMADAVRNVPGAGTVLAALVILFGNLIALVLEGVIASVQALRLEYYEFFSRFFPGDGRPFSPFQIPTETVALPPR